MAAAAIMTMVTDAATASSNNHSNESQQTTRNLSLPSFSMKRVLDALDTLSEMVVLLFVICGTMTLSHKTLCFCTCTTVVTT